MLCKDIISEKRRQRNRQGEIDREKQIGRNVERQCKLENTVEEDVCILSGTWRYCKE